MYHPHLLDLDGECFKEYFELHEGNAFGFRRDIIVAYWKVITNLQLPKGKRPPRTQDMFPIWPYLLNEKDFENYRFFHMVDEDEEETKPMNEYTEAQRDAMARSGNFDKLYESLEMDEDAG